MKNITNHTGENAPHVNNTKEQIIKTCELLCAHPDWSYARIAIQAGVHQSTVQHVAAGEQWVDVVKAYNIPQRQTKSAPRNPSRRYSESTVRQVCDLLEERYEKVRKITLREIADICGVNPGLVGQLSSGMQWERIGMDYEFYVTAHDKYHIEDDEYE